MKFTDALKIYPQHILPHHALSAIMHAATRSKSTYFKNLVIQQIIKHYKVDMSDTLVTDYRDFQTFNHFFTRALKPKARPICRQADSIACPVDGTVSQIGGIENNQIFQAKGHSYSLQTLLGNDEACEEFRDGFFATLYLSPRDYHRIHSPLNAKLKKMIHIPGKLFSVNSITTQYVPELFARNERVICLFETDAGPMAVILVGAIFVSSIETVWAGTITPPNGKTIQSWDYTNAPVELNKGDELGRFNMGSTAIVLFPKGTISWEANIKAESKIQMGQCLGKLIR